MVRAVISPYCVLPASGSDEFTKFFDLWLGCVAGVHDSDL